MSIGNIDYQGKVFTLDTDTLPTVSDSSENGDSSSHCSTSKERDLIKPCQENKTQSSSVTSSFDDLCNVSMVIDSSVINDNDSVIKKNTLSPVNASDNTVFPIHQSEAAIFNRRSIDCFDESGIPNSNMFSVQNASSNNRSQIPPFLHRNKASTKANASLTHSNHAIEFPLDCRSPPSHQCPQASRSYAFHVNSVNQKQADDFVNRSKFSPSSSFMVDNLGVFNNTVELLPNHSNNKNYEQSETLSFEQYSSDDPAEITCLLDNSPVKNV